MIDYKIISSLKLFNGIPEAEIDNVLKSLDIKIFRFSKEQEIYKIGDKIETIGIVLSGKAYVAKYDVWGNLHIIDNVERGEIFAEAYAVQEEMVSMINVISAKDTEIMFIKSNNILKGSSLFHHQLISNLLRILAFKNLKLIKKIEHITPKSARERVLSYFSFQKMINHNQASFEIPFNRQQLADYLLLERSVLSHELSKMKKDGLIDYYKNKFTLTAKF